MAIAFDASAHIAVGGATTWTLAHTVTGSNVVLVVGISSEVDTPTGVTYNGVAMTLGPVSLTTTKTAIYYLAAPATGVHNIVASFGAYAFGGIASVSLTGANTASPLDTSGKSNANGVTSSTVNVTTTTANSMLVDFISDSYSDALTAGSSQTQRQQFASDARQIAMSTKPTTTAGSYSSSWTCAYTDNYDQVVIAIKAAASGSVLTKTQSANGRVKNTIVKTQSAVGKIIQSAVPTKTQSAIAKIAKTVTTVQSATANISLPANTPPTTVLNSPADTTTGISTVPALAFTGTDANADTIEYQLQVDSTNTFTGAPSAEDNYSETNRNTSMALDSLGSGVDRKGLAQSFTGNGLALDDAKFYLSKVGTPTGTAVAKIYALSGTYGVNALISGAALATSNALDVSTLTGTWALSTFTFSGANRITLGDTVTYFVSLEFAGGNGTNYVSVGMATASTIGDVNGTYNLSSWTRLSGYALCFYVNGSSGVPLISALSTTNPGFTAGHPFASGAQKTYTVQTALANSTLYYWRVRGIDPLGSNTWGAYSTINSFTTAGVAVRTLAQTTTGRIANTTTKTQFAIGKIIQSVNLTKSQLAAGRILQPVTKSQSTLAKISQSRSTTQTVVSRIAAGFTKSQIATAHIIQSVSSLKTQPAIARIITTPIKTQLVTAKIVQSSAGAKTQSATMRVASAITKLQPATTRISKTYTNSQTTIGRITELLSKTELAIARTATAVTKTQPTTAKILPIIALVKTQTAVTRIIVSKTTTQPTTARIAASRASTQASTARVAQSFTKIQNTLGRVANNATKPQTVTSNLIQSTSSFKVQAAQARLIKAVTRTQPATGRIVAIPSKTQPSIARVSASRTLTQTSIARVQKTVIKTQTAVVRIVTPMTRTQPVTAKIVQSFGVLKVQSAVARISTKRTGIQTSISRITINRSIAQTAISKIITNTINTKVQVATSRTVSNLTKVQTSTAKITLTAINVKTQPATSRIVVIKVTTQPAIAIILKITTKTQVGISRVAITPNKTQNVTASILHAFLITQTQTATGTIKTTASKSQSASARIYIPFHLMWGNIDWLGTSYPGCNFTNITLPVISTWTPPVIPIVTIVTSTDKKIATWYTYKGDTGPDFQ